jgi:hypothetical protein
MPLSLGQQANGQFDAKSISSLNLSIKCHSVEIFLAKRYVAIIFCGYQHRSAASQLLHLQRN